MIPTVHKSANGLKKFQLFLNINVSPMEEIGLCEGRLEIQAVTHLRQSPGLGPGSGRVVDCQKRRNQKLCSMWVKVRLWRSPSPMHTARTLQHAFLAECTVTS